MKITCKLFAILRDRAGVAEVALDLPRDATVASAAQALAAAHPKLRDFLPRVAYAVNRAYATADTTLHDHDELALIPPVSGGT